MDEKRLKKGVGATLVALWTEYRDARKMGMTPILNERKLKSVNNGLPCDLRFDILGENIKSNTAN